MAAVLLVICILGCFSSAYGFRAEVDEGKFDALLFTSSFGWAVGAFLTFYYLVNV